MPVCRGFKPIFRQTKQQAEALKAAIFWMRYYSPIRLSKSDSYKPENTQSCQPFIAFGHDARVTVGKLSGAMAGDRGANTRPYPFWGGVEANSKTKMAS
jgi:hypothetical protein